jgi:hypothetical protein
MNIGWRVFYEQDIRGNLRRIHESYLQVRSVYIGPPGRSINRYERLGRFIVGTLLVIVWLWVGAVCLAMAVGLWLLIRDLLHLIP